MKRSLTTTALLALVPLMAPAAFAGLAQQSPAPQCAAFENIAGTIQRVAADGQSFVLTVDEQPVTVKVNERTQFTLDGEASSGEHALVVGRKARVSHEDGTATQVAVMTSEG